MNRSKKTLIIITVITLLFSSFPLYNRLFTHSLHDVENPENFSFHYRASIFEQSPTLMIKNRKGIFIEGFKADGLVHRTVINYQDYIDSLYLRLGSSHPEGRIDDFMVYNWSVRKLNK